MVKYVQLKDFISTIVPQIPDMLKGKLTFVANHGLNAKEVQIFGMALQAIVLQLEEDKITKEKLNNVNAIFTKDGSFAMYEENSNTFGLHFSLAVYAIENLRKLNNERFLLVAFIEELVHHYWRIEDETKVKYKVIEIAQKIDNNITIEMLKGWGVNGL